MDNRYYCTLFAKDPNNKPIGFHKLLENMFGTKYGGFRYDRYKNGYQVWFRNQDDMLTLKMLSGKKV